MANSSDTNLVITELDFDGRPTTTFSFEPQTSQLRPLSPRSPAKDGSSLLLKCLGPFLPAGYPLTVTTDYTPYQIYDSLQAFASTIAGLLASRAVFVGMGVGSEDASLVTTMLLYIAQETIGRVATILFAHRFSQRIEAEVKFYRFFADIVNDLAFILDCMSPGMPIFGRVFTLCISNACRAACGVAGGSSKAILSSHFARADNIGELNAKDGSQETVVSLVGMWVGGLVVSKVHGTVGTWSCLLPLLAFHLWANWKAVKSVRLNSLNADRALILFHAMLQGQVRNVDQVGKDEGILGFEHRFHGHQGDKPTADLVGVGLNEFLLCMQGPMENGLRKGADFIRLTEMFEAEEYLLWVDLRKCTGMILLKESASGETQAKGFCHMLRCLIGYHDSTDFAGIPDQRVHSQRSDMASRELANVVSGAKKATALEKRQDLPLSADHDNGYVFELLKSTLRENQKQWPMLREQAQTAGWDLSLTRVVKGQGHRIRVDRALDDGKKDQ